MEGLTVHGAATYRRIEPGSAENLSEEEYVSLMLGPRRQDDKVLARTWMVSASSDV